MGFFASSDVVSKPPVSHIPQCGKCGLYKFCKSPKMPVDGEGRKGILIIGEAPGKNEDDEGKPFVGKEGERLRNDLSLVDLNLRKDCWITNSIICHPENNVYPENALEYCRPNVINTVKELNPRVIVLLGAHAIKSLLGWAWKEEIGAMGRWAGWKIPLQKLNTWIITTWHPSYLEREHKEVRDVLARNHLEMAAKAKGRPWKTLPVYKVNRIYKGDDASPEIDKMIGETPIAIDYETNMLEPYSKDARIVSCALSDGGKTIAYPWSGKAIDATKRLLISGTPMTASNVGFEEEWTIAAFGRGVTNWYWDCVVNAHILSWDGAGDMTGGERGKGFTPGLGITSIKFQAFVLLGIDSWDMAIRPFLRANGPHKKNRIHEISLPKLLQYNGMDALVDAKVGSKQRKLAGKE